jgi:hypothetical protein
MLEVGLDPNFLCFSVVAELFSLIEFAMVLPDIFMLKVYSMRSLFGLID